MEGWKDGPSAWFDCAHQPPLRNHVGRLDGWKDGRMHSEVAWEYYKEAEIRFLKFEKL